MTNYSESEFVIPALEFMKANPAGVSTSQLIKHLMDVFKPNGYDMEILNNRSDTHFSQKVRNLKSHDTFQKKNLATYQKVGRHGIWHITPKGIKYLEGIEIAIDDTQPEDIKSSLNSQGFSKKIIQKEAEKDYTGLIIEEGSLDKRTTAQRNRSNKLREIAINEFKKKHDGKLFCMVCGFDFYETYGGIGKDFIEIHHLELMHLMDIEGEQITVEEALKKIATVCPNCHRIIHREKGKILSIEDLKALLEQAK